MSFRNLGTFRYRGHSDTIDASAYQSLGSVTAGLTLDYPTAAAAIAVASTDNVDDVPAGTGATIVRVRGVSLAGVEISEDFVLNGQTKVSGSLLFWRINSMEILESGTDGSNVGGVWVGPATDVFTAGVPVSKFNYIAPGISFDSCGMYTVPVDRRIVFRTFALTAFGATAGKVMTAQLQCRRATSNVWIVPLEHHISDNGYSLRELIIAEPGMDLRLMAQASAAGGRMSITMTGEIEKETYQRT